MFSDLAKIFIKGGDGGNGAVTFHREKYALTAAMAAAAAASSLWRIKTSIR